MSEASAVKDGRNILEISSIVKEFTVKGERVRVLDDVSLEVRRGEFLVIVGHSGCGKSTLLKIIAGLEEPTSGACLLDGARVTGPGPDRTMVFQEHRLFPWMSIQKNVEFGLQGAARAERERIARQYLSLVDLQDFADAYPSQLSGGMSQRAAIARALATGPEVMLLDEPLSALDAFTRAVIQDEILKMRDRFKPIILMVTHDIEEAVYLADRIVVMSARPGRVEEVIDVALGRPRDRGSADFAWYKKRVYDHFFKAKEKEFDYVI